MGFEGAQSRGKSRVERNTEGGRPSEEEPKGNGGQSVNLPPLLAAQLGRGKNGQPLQSSLTSTYRGQALPNNIGGNLPSNGGARTTDLLKWGPNHGLLPSLSKSSKEILATEKVARSFEPPPKMFGNYGGKESIFPPVAKVNNAPVIIEAKIFRRKVGRVYMDSGSSCEIIYDHCFEKLNPTIKATKVDLETPLVGFSGECSWSIGIPRTIMVEGKPFNTEHKLNEYNHVKPIKQNRRGLGLDHNMAACKEIEELTKAGILRKVKH
ncbi:hypothetical protein Tco_0386848 [Tanacetum coccineum]